MPDTSKATVLRFGVYELDLEAERLLKDGRTVRLQPQPFRLLRLLVSQRGRLISRDEIQATLWKDQTFVDFEQGVNFAIKQVREALDDRAQSPLFIQTVPKRGYRFVAPVIASDDDLTSVPAHDPQLDKVLWENIIDLRLAENRRSKQLKLIMMALALLAVAVLLLLLRVI